MAIYGIRVDLEKGFDVLRGRKLLRHFDSYDEAAAYARERGGRYIRYYAEKEAAAQ